MRKADASSVKWMPIFALSLVSSILALSAAEHALSAQHPVQREPNGAAGRCADLFRSDRGRVAVGRVVPLGSQPNVEEFLDNTYAVHATGRVPEDGVITAGNSERGGAAEKLVHFAIGHLVPRHLAGEWDTKQVAVLVPLRDVMPKAVNFFAQDTAVIGDYKIPANAIVLIRRGSGFEGKEYPFHAVTFEGDLREAIEAELLLRKSSVVHMRENSGFPGDPAHLNGYDINSRDFFRQVKARYPQIEEGNAMESVFHKTDYYLKTAYAQISSDDGSHVRNSSLELGLFSLTLERRMGLMRRRIEAQPFSAEQKRQIGQQVGVYDEMLAEIRSKKGVAQHSKFHLETEIAFLNSDLPSAEFEKLVDGLGSEDSSAKKLVLKHITHRLQRLPRGEREVGALLARFDEILRTLQPREREDVVREALRYPLSQYFDVDLHDGAIVGRFEKLVHLDSVSPIARKILERNDLRFSGIGSAYRKRRALLEFIGFFRGMPHKSVNPDLRFSGFELVRRLVAKVEYATRRVGLIRALNEFLPNIAPEMIRQSRVLGDNVMRAHPGYGLFVKDTSRS